MKDIQTIWYERKLFEPQNVGLIQAFIQEFSAESDFYVEAETKHGHRYIHIINESETKTDLGNDLVMVDSRDMIVFYPKTTRLQSSYWIMKRKPGVFEMFQHFYPPLYLDKTEDPQCAIDLTVERILNSGNRDYCEGDCYMLAKDITEALESGEDLLMGEYLKMTESIKEYAEDVTSKGDLVAMADALRLMSDEIIRLREELKAAEQFKRLYLSKWEKWEERARALQLEVKSNDN